ncbi:hypothetical protein P154DRAFT_525462 [Amniculicola lignicola CBS 123094]|uniref:Uncharacterized protein n=1 Tax=Amniculicola lignicola CBS 123094 TaxID=1392246 RepID=A0A6A5WBW6_9PLEO|nr:hypothetical protein P154DRAFT_525462 [Amniculicola lignicola CBS 123094]
MRPLWEDQGYGRTLNPWGSSAPGRSHTTDRGISDPFRFSRSHASYRPREIDYAKVSADRDMENVKIWVSKVSDLQKKCKHLHEEGDRLSRQERWREATRYYDTLKEELRNFEREVRSRLQFEHDERVGKVPFRC